MSGRTDAYTDDDDDLDAYYRACRDESDDDNASDEGGGGGGIGEGVSPMRGKPSLSLSTPHRLMKKHRNEGKLSSKAAVSSIPPPSARMHELLRSTAAQANVMSLKRSLVEVESSEGARILNKQPGDANRLMSELLGCVGHQQPSALFALNSSTGRWEAGKGLMPISRSQQLGEAAHHLIGDSLAAFTIARHLVVACLALLEDSDQVLMSKGHDSLECLYALIIRRFADLVGHIVDGLRPNIPDMPEHNTGRSASSLVDAAPTTTNIEHTLMAMYELFEKCALLLPLGQHSQNRAFSSRSSRVNAIIGSLLEQIGAAQLGCQEEKQKLWIELYIYASWPVFDLVGQGVSGSLDVPAAMSCTFGWANDGAMGGIFDAEPTLKAFQSLLTTVTGGFASVAEVAGFVAVTRDQRRRPLAKRMKEMPPKLMPTVSSNDEDSNWGSNPASARSSGVARSTEPGRVLSHVNTSPTSLSDINPCSKATLIRLCQSTSERLGEPFDMIGSAEAVLQQAMGLVEWLDQQPLPKAIPNYLGVATTPFPSIVIRVDSDNNSSTQHYSRSKSIQVDCKAPFREWFRGVYIEPLSAVLHEQQQEVVSQLLRPSGHHIGALELMQLIRNVAFMGHVALLEVFLSQISTEGVRTNWYKRAPADDVPPNSLTASSLLTAAFIEARAQLPNGGIISLVVLPSIIGYVGSRQREMLSAFEAFRFVFDVSHSLSFMVPTLAEGKASSVSAWLHLDSPDLLSRVFSLLCTLQFCRAQLLTQMKDNFISTRRLGSHQRQAPGSFRRNYVLRVVLDILINFTLTTVEEGARQFERACSSLTSLEEFKAAYNKFLSTLRVTLLMPSATEPTASVLSVQLSAMRESLQLFTLIALGDSEHYIQSEATEDMATERIDKVITNFIQSGERLPAASDYYTKVKPLLHNLTFNKYFDGAATYGVI